MLINVIISFSPVLSQRSSLMYVVADAFLLAHSLDMYDRNIVILRKTGASLHTPMLQSLLDATAPTPEPAPAQVFTITCSQYEY